MNDAARTLQGASAPGRAETPEDMARIRRFELRVAVCASGGKFCDGWILAVIGVALPFASTGLGLSATWEGLIGASALLGIFFGGIIFGRVTDIIGRKKMFLFTLLTFLICSALQLFVVDALQLFILRFIMGMADGADYAIAGSMIAEFTSRKRRGPYLAGMIIWWYAGFALSASGAILLISAMPDSPNLWRWILASASVPALIMLLIRIGLPESPRWLAGQGRLEEAREIAARYMDRATQKDVFAEPPGKASYADLFSKANIRKTALTSIFWMAQVTPLFAIFTFLPRVIELLDLGMDADWGQIALYLFLLVGSIAGALVINRLGRRRLLIWTFVVTAASMLVLGLFPDGSPVLVVSCFIVFAFFNAAAGVLQILYPSEIFPTDIRATAVGFAGAMSRIGAAAGTFLIPIGLVHLGVGPVMLISAGILVAGLVVSVMWAPETKDLELTTATGAIGVVPRS